jgi:signal transduction histidine kinase
MKNIHELIDILENHLNDPVTLTQAEQEEVRMHIVGIANIIKPNNKKSRNRLNELITICSKLSKQEFDVTYQSSSAEDEIDTIGIALESLANELNYSLQTLSNYDNRINELIEVLSSYAQLDFTAKANLSDKQDEIDAIAFGLNMLGQEIDYYQTQLREKTHSLEESQRIGKLGSWEFNFESGKVYGSNEFYAIYELNPDTQLTSESFSELIEQKYADELNKLSEQSIKSKKPYSYEYPITTATGKRRYVKAYGEIKYDNDVPIKSMGTIIDITEIQQAKEELDILNKDLEKKVEERTADLESFTYSVSHDLRAPLRAINGFSEIMEEDYKTVLDDEGKRLLGIIRSNASKMSNLIDDLLKFSRLNNQTINKQEINMNLMIAELVNELNASYNHLTIDYNINNLPTIIGDNMLLKQVWQNLIDNAIKYSSKEEKINITIKELDEESGFHTIAISDNGVGFDQQYQDKLFEVFQRLHPQNEFNGTGVGLSIVKRIIDKHNGKIAATSAINKGATFVVSIPKNA